MNSNIQKRFKAVKLSKTFNNILDSLVLRDKKTLDLGCGYGEYLVNFGRGSCGVTTAKNEVDYGKENGVSIVYGNVEIIDELKLDNNFKVIWANNLFEHILSPHAFLIKLKVLAEEDAMLVLGVPVIPRFNFLLRFKKFRGSLSTSHINFFTKDSLVLSVERAGWRVKDVRSFVFKSVFLDKMTNFISPHLYIIAENNKNFKYHNKKLKEWENDLYYQHLLKITKQKNEKYKFDIQKER